MGLLDSLEERSHRLSDDMTALSEGDINPAQMALRTAGETVGGLGDVAAPVLDFIVPDLVKEGMAQVVQGVLETGPAKYALKWAEEHPEQARDITMAFNAAELLPGMALARTGRNAIEGMVGAKAGKGMSAAPFDNYIDEFYGETTEGASKAQQLAGKAAEKLRGVSPEYSQAAGKKIANTIGTVGRGVGNSLLDLANPEARALYKGTGVSRGGQKIVQRHLDDLEAGKGSRQEAKGVAEAIYQRHIGEQAGREGPIHTDLQDIMDKSTVEGYQANHTGAISQILQRNTGSKKSVDGDWEPIQMSNAEARKAEEFILGAQQGADKLVVKQPASKKSGDHRNDLFSTKNPARAALNRAFKNIKEFDSVKELKEAISEQKLVRDKMVAKDPKLSNFNIVGEDGTGIWLQVGKAGSAIVEGGINGLIKVRPSGEFFAVMSDKHDFLEKVPGIKQAARQILPEHLVAITPPMYGHIKAKDVSVDTPEYRLSSTEKRAPKQKGDKTIKENLQGIANAKADPNLVKAETRHQAGNMAIGASLLDFNLNQEEPQ